MPSTAKTVAGMLSGDGPTRLPALRAFLDCMKRRWRVGALLAAAVWSVVAALALACEQKAAALLLPKVAMLRWLAPGLGSQVAIEPVVAAFAATFAVGCLVMYLRTPDLRSFARAAEQKLALRERLSTALDVDEDAPAHAPLDVVRSALLAEVERRAAGLDPRAVVRLAVPRAAWLVPILILVGALLHLVPADAFASRSATAGPRDGGALSGEAAENAAGNLRRIADLLGQDAERRADPYLRTIARAIERLGTELGHASLDRRQLANALDQLLAHSRQAYAQGDGRNGGETQRHVIDLLAAAREEIAGTRPVVAAMPHQGNDPDAAPPDAAAAQAVADAARPAPPRATHRLRPSAAATPLPGVAADRANAQEDGGDYGDLENDPRTQKERAFAEQQRRLRAAAQAVGAAADAGAGEGDRAGNGTRPLGSGGASPTDLVPGAEMLLPDQAGNDGRRIRIEVPPQTALSNVTPPTMTEDHNWRRASEQPVSRQALDAQNRKVVGRYFARPVEGGGR
jgi:hypothetical protein